MGLGQDLEVQHVAHFVLFSSLSYLSRSSCNATQQDVILGATEFMVRLQQATRLGMRQSLRRA